MSEPGGREIRITPTRGRLGGSFRFEDTRTREAGTFTVRLRRGNRFEGFGVRRTFGQDGFLLPRFFAVDDSGETVAALTYNLMTGALHLEAAGAPPTDLERSGLVFPSLALRDAHGNPVVLAETRHLYGREYAARLLPTEEWPMDRLVGVLALLFHAKISLNLVFLVAGGSGALAPI